MLFSVIAVLIYIPTEISPNGSSPFSTVSIVFAILGFCIIAILTGMR